MGDEFLHSKKFADLRIKMGAKRSQNGSLKNSAMGDYEQAPTDLDDNHWAEINKYNYHLWVQDNERRKQDIKSKKELVKSTLDKQLKEQTRQRQQINDYNKKMDRILLDNAKREIEMEKKERLDHKKKVE